MSTARRPPAAPPLYTIAIVPDYADEDFRGQRYGAWYVSHADEAALALERLQFLFDQGCVVGAIDPADEEIMANFSDYLETQGYIVQQTAGDGYVVLTTGVGGRLDAGGANDT